MSDWIASIVLAAAAGWFGGHFIALLIRMP